MDTDVFYKLTIETRLFPKNVRVRLHAYVSSPYTTLADYVNRVSPFFAIGMILWLPSHMDLDNLGKSKGYLTRGISA